ncbi:MAG: MBL fold metallo-hydrolase [Blastocatellia bacterium]|nr:MAG: MBL fold metallo-hydrolase [Blastocatellia bacterium]
MVVLTSCPLDRLCLLSNRSIQLQTLKHNNTLKTIGHILLFLLFAFSVQAQTKTEVILLGTGTPYPDPSASGPATVVKVGDRVFLFDAGAGVMRKVNAAGLPLSGPEAVFFTHLHSDHTLGYADLILTTWIMRRTKALQAYGPHGLKSMTRHLLLAFAEDIDIRTKGLEREVPGGYRVDVHEITEGVVYERDGVRVTAIVVPHGSWKEAYGYRVDTPDRSIVISGDTAPSKNLMAASQGVDVLVHEVYLSRGVKVEDRPGGEFWPEYMRKFHTSELELGSLANLAKPKLLLLTHIIRFGGTDEEIISGIRKAGFTGDVIAGTDLGRY